MIEVSEQIIRATAAILGPQSACAKAIKDADLRRSRGESVAFFKDGNAVLVMNMGADSATERKS